MPTDSPALTRSSTVPRLLGTRTPTRRRLARWDLALHHRAPLELHLWAVVWFAAHAVEGMEAGTATVLPDPAPAWRTRLAAGVPAGRGRAEALVRGSRTSRTCHPISRLGPEDADRSCHPLAVDEALSRAPALRPLVEARPGVRVLRLVDPEETVRTLIGQQISRPPRARCSGAGTREMG
ncbi:hypothetical protein QJS66_13435 [Kocuria rhizophila]|nr:hypothetical protein QJS66_13435 [Kocuria rhizophila]